MDPQQEFTFILNQFGGGFLCLFFLYFAWKDQFIGNYSPYPKISKPFILSILSVIGVGLFSYFFGQWHIFGLFISIEYAILIVLALYDPKYAVAFFIYILISRPWESFDHSLMQSLPRDTFYLTMISFIGHRLIRRRFYFEWSPISAIVFLFAAWMFFSVITCNHMSWALKQFNEVFMKSVIVYFLIVNVVLF